MIGFFGELIWSKQVHGRLYPSLMYPRARDEGRSRHVSWAKHRLWFFLDGCLCSVCLCALACAVSMACPCVRGRNGSGGSPKPPKQRKPDESNALCLGARCDLDTTPRNQVRPFHSLSCRTKESHRKPSKPIPPFGGHPFHHLVFWVGHLFQPFFIVWCIDCLFCRFTDPSKSSVTGKGFLNHSFSLPQGS